MNLKLIVAASSLCIGGSRIAAAQQPPLSRASLAGCWRIHVDPPPAADMNGLQRVAIPEFFRLYDSTIGTRAAGVTVGLIRPSFPSRFRLASGWSFQPPRTAAVWWTSGLSGVELSLTVDDSGTALTGRAQQVSDVIIGGISEPATAATAKRVECPASLQGLPRPDSVTLRGTVIDRSTGHPVAGAYVAFLRDANGWTIADSSGRFTIAPFSRGREPLIITCPRPRDVWGETLDTVVVELRSGLDTSFTVPVNGSKCDLPPFAERHLELRGYYSTGFEENRFLPDPDSHGKPIIWGGNPAGRYAEIQFTSSARAHLRWPPHKAASSYCYRVRWTGTLTGPGAKNPAPPGTFTSRIAAYTFVVDSIRSITSASPARCERQ